MVVERADGVDERFVALSFPPNILCQRCRIPSAAKRSRRSANTSCVQPEAGFGAGDEEEASKVAVPSPEPLTVSSLASGPGSLVTLLLPLTALRERGNQPSREGLAALAKLLSRVEWLGASNCNSKPKGFPRSSDMNVSPVNLGNIAWPSRTYSTAGSSLAPSLAPPPSPQPEELIGVSTIVVLGAVSSRPPLLPLTPPLISLRVFARRREGLSAALDPPRNDASAAAARGGLRLPVGLEGALWGAPAPASLVGAWVTVGLRLAAPRPAIGAGGVGVTVGVRDFKGLLPVRSSCLIGVRLMRVPRRRSSPAVTPVPTPPRSIYS